MAVYDDPFELLEKSYKLVQKRLSGQTKGDLKLRKYLYAAI